MTFVLANSNLQKSGLCNTVKDDVENPSNQIPMKKLLVSGLISALFISGCGWFTETAQIPEKATNADTVLNQEIYDWAVSEKQQDKCAGISDAGIRQECEDVIEGLILTDKAVETLDKSLCGDIALQDYEDNCDEKVAFEITKEEEKNAAEEQAQKDEENRVELEQEAIDKSDASICDDMKSEEEMYSCKYNVLANKAYAKNNPTICEEIGEESRVEECKKTINFQD